MSKYNRKIHIWSLGISHFIICTVVGFALDAQELPGKEESVSGFASQFSGWKAHVFSENPGKIVLIPQSGKRSNFL